MKSRTWTEDQLKNAVSKSRSYRQVLSCLNLREAGGNYAQIKKYIGEYNFKIDHFKGKGWNKGMSFSFMPKLPLSRILVKDSDFQSYKLKSRLIREGLKTLRCEKCGWKKEAKNGRIPLELHHLNGNSRDHRLKNLKILCPNCHSLEPNYRGLNKKQYICRGDAIG